MPCEEMQLWTFSGLVGAYLDLAIASLLLCASTIAYLASKILGLFGLSLPCPCNGLFGDPNNSNCWQRVLVHCPSGKMASVQFSVKSRFPFDSTWDNNLSSRMNGNLMEKSVQQGEGLSSPFQDSSEMDVTNVRERRPVVEEGLEKQKPRYDLRRRRKRDANISISSYELLVSDVQAVPQSPISLGKTVNGSNADDVVHAGSGGDALYCEDGRISSTEINLYGTVSHFSESNESAKENKPTEKCAAPTGNMRCNVLEELDNDGDGKSTIRLLEKKLKEEYAAHAILHLELEKERNAAATAADEAMAMILHLQQEKAAIEMEYRQYQRMIEEKSAYDYEEMNILKEILLRREREKHFLEKEVEAYRQTNFGIEELEYNIRAAESKNLRLAFGKESPIPFLEKVDPVNQGSIHSHPTEVDQQLSIENEGINIEFQEKGLISMPLDESPFDQEREVQRLDACSELNLLLPQLGYDMHNEAIAPVEEIQSISTGQGLALKTKSINQTKIIFPYSCDDSEEQEKDLLSDLPNVGSFVNDVHVVDQKVHVCFEVSESENEKPSAVLDIPRASDTSIMSGADANISRSCSDIMNGSPLINSSRRKPLPADLRRNSMSAVDYERFKIDHEVGWLRERLRIVQGGREKLNVSMGHMEKEKTQLQDVASQLREIRKIREPALAGHEALLLPPSFKVPSKKKRHWRSVSLGVRRST